MNEPTLRHAGVPYYTQWGSPAWVRQIVEQHGDPCDDPDWQRSGFSDPERYRFWAKRLCGLTCLESALDYWRIEHAPRAVLLDEALRHGAYRMRDDGGVDGLIYQPFAAWAANAFGLQVDVLPQIPLEAIAARLAADTLAIVSVSPEIRYPERANRHQGGHLILLHGRDRDGVWFHNPSGIAPHQADVYLPFDTMARFYAGRGMTLTRSTRAARRAS
ncbi:MAG TPA: C39 family peptidase [Paraburkholderia sp.]